jgi:HEAT repeat protein
VKTPKVITESRVVVEEPECQVKFQDDKDTAKLFEKLRRRKSELLKKLRIGDKARRKETIRELAGFSFDDKVREALEVILLSDPDPELRRQVAKSFGKTSNKKVLPALEIASTDDPNKEVRQEAYKAIMKIRAN